MSQLTDPQGSPVVGVDLTSRGRTSPKGSYVSTVMETPRKPITPERRHPLLKVLAIVVDYAWSVKDAQWRSRLSVGCRKNSIARKK